MLDQLPERLATHGPWVLLALTFFFGLPRMIETGVYRARLRFERSRRGLPEQVSLDDVAHLVREDGLAERLRQSQPSKTDP